MPPTAPMPAMTSPMPSLEVSPSPTLIAEDTSWGAASTLSTGTPSAAVSAAGDAARLLRVLRAALPTAWVGAAMVATTLTLAALTCSVMSSGETPSSCAARLALKAVWALAPNSSRVVVRVRARVIVALATGALEGGAREEGGGLEED